MTKPITSKHQRLLAIEREVRLLREAMPDAIKLRVDNALLVAMNLRLIGENDALRRNVKALEAHIESLKGLKVAA